jgi:hypothetical protein
MIPLPQIAAAVVAVGAIGGGALTLDKLHVASEDFSQHLAYEQSRYVLQIKKDIREIRYIVIDNPDDQYLENVLADMIDELCEIRPEDRECAFDDDALAMVPDDD